ncbi:hypothetical protein PENTCL1PPCAC_24965 [Pristionchus entomophagus]|uniref:Fatty acid hydroxylase domain-containing protein n=1 Tax=Pristionchus entomophagus TaxID=358040 RepID=A0AAV5U7C4_9BILA|nr:hypothetical protein PENTCL1PPCAC_24965 [Pristionchus entomophagus]
MAFFLTRIFGSAFKTLAGLLNDGSQGTVTSTGTVSSGIRSNSTLTFNPWNLKLSHLRYLFYAVTPEETTFASIDDVPDYTKIVTVWLGILIIAEMLFLSRKQYALNDTVTSVTSGMMYLLFKFSGKYLSAALYVAVYDKFHLVDLDPFNPWVWIMCFLTQDLAYYLAHRTMHECGIFWAFHQMHHSSEYYNLSTATRKGMFLEVGAFGFDLLQCLLIPPQIFLPHKYFNLLYQFWLHTELVPPLGPLEYIINTPSAHRVHHGRNPYCIDRNYGGTLIIWDRLFGTYAAEKRDERISYGLVENVKSFNAIWLQWFDLHFFLFGKGLMRKPDGEEYFPGVWNKIIAIFAPPGYYPGVKTRRFFWWRYMEDNTFNIPEVDHSEPKYDPPMSPVKKLYLISQFVFLLTFAHPFLERRLEMDWMEFVAQIVMIISTIQCFGYYFDHDPNAVFHDRMRCFGILGYCMRYQSIALMIIAVLNIPCILYLENEDKLSEPATETVEEPRNVETEKKERKKRSKAIKTE